MPGASEPLFDLDLVELSLGLRDPSEAVSVDAEESERRILVGTNAGEGRDELHELTVALADSVTRRRRREPDRLVVGSCLAYNSFSPSPRG